MSATKLSSKCQSDTEFICVETVFHKHLNIGHSSKFPLHKNFKLVLEQKVTSQTYLKISYISQKCLVQLINQSSYLVN